MRGLFKRTGSDIWQAKFRIPESIWRHRPRLIALGVKDIGKAQEFGRTTGKLNRDEAAEVYRVMLVQWDEKLAAWQALLDSGPQSLSHKQRIALAADHAKAYLAAHEDEPFAAPRRLGLDATPTSWPTWEALIETLRPEDREALRKDVAAFYRAKGERQAHVGFRLLERYRHLMAEDTAHLATDLEALHGHDTDAALAAQEIHVDRTTRSLINFEMTAFMGAAERGLDARRGNDYRPVPELEAAPTFVHSPSAPGVGQAASTALPLEDLLDHKAKTTSIRPKTVAGNRSYLKIFAKFLGHDDARRVTKDDIRRWRDSLIEAGLAPKTVTDKYLSAVRSVLAYGVKEFDLPLNVASGIADRRLGRAPERSKGWSEEEAVTILNATFSGSSKALSEPHRRAIFWLPWMLAYTGLRATEAAQFRGRHLREEDGAPYLLITPADGSTKSGKAWAVGIHKHLIELGLLDLIQEVGDGPLFYEPYPADVDPGAIRGRHRAEDATKRVGDWITSELGLVAPLGHPLHAFRHLFTTRSRQHGLLKEPRDFMMGSRSVTDAREGYGDWPPSVLDAEINKLPRFPVKDTGRRP